MSRQYSISPLFKVTRYTSKAQDVASGDVLEYTGTLKKISGYSPVGIVGTTTNHEWSFALFQSKMNSDNTFIATWMNFNKGTWKGAYGIVDVLYIKNLQHSISQCLWSGKARGGSISVPGLKNTDFALFEFSAYKMLAHCHTADGAYLIGNALGSGYELLFVGGEISISGTTINLSNFYMGKYSASNLGDNAIFNAGDATYLTAIYAAQYSISPTVLWSGKTNSGAIILPESIYNYSVVGFWVSAGSSDDEKDRLVLCGVTPNMNFISGASGGMSNSDIRDIRVGFAITSATTLTYVNVIRTMLYTNEWTVQSISHNRNVFGVVGIAKA